MARSHKVIINLDEKTRLPCNCYTLKNITFATVTKRYQSKEQAIMRKAILFSIMIFSALAMQAQDITSFVSRQMQEYPKSRLLDIYKACFQDCMGAEHLVSDTASTRKYLDYELSATSLSDLMPWYYEPCGVNGNYVRVSLRTVKEGLISKEQLLEAFIRSANSARRPSVESWKHRWREIADTIAKMNIQFPHYNEDKQYIDSILSAGKYAISHSQDYRDAYRPHYRIISREIFDKELFPLITKKQ